VLPPPPPPPSSSSPQVCSSSPPWCNFTHADLRRSSPFGIDIEPPLLLLMTSSLHILRSLGMVCNNGSVVPSTTDAWRSLFIWLSSPPATHQPLLGAAVFVVVIRSMQARPWGGRAVRLHWAPGTGGPLPSMYILVYYTYTAYRPSPNTSRVREN
jgi:hypothetical protein